MFQILCKLEKNTKGILRIINEIELVQIENCLAYDCNFSAVWTKALFYTRGSYVVASACDVFYKWDDFQWLLSDWGVVFVIKMIDHD